MELNKVYNEDCLIGMSRIPDKSVDMILCDLPYGTTACKWDVVIPMCDYMMVNDKVMPKEMFLLDSFKKGYEYDETIDLWEYHHSKGLWYHYDRVIKDNGAIVLTASQPFTTDLINSNRKLFKYELIWNKKQGGNPLLARKQPMKAHENVLIFYKNKGVYNPQMEVRGALRKKGTLQVLNNDSFLGDGKIDTRSFNNEYYPKSILDISNAEKRGLIHPTQKPVALFEYLIKTYTNEGETVLDNCMGSGTTAIACINTNRNYIGFEKEEKYYQIIQDRIKKHTPQLKLIA
jgi:site-specific DNA-methyltransferase (adenine-specific)